MRAIARIETVAAWAAALLLTLTGFFLTYEVVARYFFNAPTIWAAEISQLCLIWGCPIAMAWILTTRRHIRVTAVTSLLSPALRIAAEIFSNLVIIAFSAWVIWYGYEIFLDSFERGRTTGTMLDLPAWIYEASVPAGFVLLIVAALRSLARALRGEVPEDGEMAE